VDILLEKAGKKFYREWIFRNLDFTVSAGESLAVLGPNGSGKSTLLKVIAGSMMPSEGQITYSSDGVITDPADIFKDVSISAPYLELPEEFTLEEIVRFHFRFKRPVNSLTTAEIISITGLGHAAQKVFRYFSSGMKQRVKNALAILSDTKLLLLDEPCSNLDEDAINWYKELVLKYAAGRVVVVCSNNQESEVEHCLRRINMADYKNRQSSPDLQHQLR